MSRFFDRLTATGWSTLLAIRDPSHADYQEAWQKVHRKFGESIADFYRVQFPISVQEAEDWAQEFFAKWLVPGNALNRWQPSAEHPHFRNYLYGCVRNFGLSKIEVLRRREDRCKSEDMEALMRAQPAAMKVTGHAEPEASQVFFVRYYRALFEATWEHFEARQQNLDSPEGKRTMAQDAWLLKSRYGLGRDGRERTVTELAEMMETSVSTVSRRLERAKSVFKMFLADELAPLTTSETLQSEMKDMMRYLGMIWLDAAESDERPLLD